MNKTFYLISIGLAPYMTLTNDELLELALRKQMLEENSYEADTKIQMVRKSWFIISLALLSFVFLGLFLWAFLKRTSFLKVFRRKNKHSTLTKQL